MGESKYIGPCTICKAYLPLDDTDKWVYHKSVGVVCTKHHGIESWYNGLLQAAQREYQQIVAMSTGKK